ncbi:MAG: hypothetical protein LBI48_04670 [Burkholderiaceae bacterium]|jgi:hypothetical protein|nr:hypothetical protein [Burkholderiaceae bacterium]
MLCVLMQALGIDIGKMTEQAHARAQSGGPPPPGASAAPQQENPVAASRCEAKPACPTLSPQKVER